MKKFKQVFLGLLTVSVSILVLSACRNSDSSSNNENGSGDNGTVKIDDDHSVGAMDDFKAGEQFKATEPLTISMMFSDHPNYPYDKEWLFFSKLKEMTDVEFDMTVIPSSDYEQKRSLMISAGESPIIIPKSYPGTENAFVTSGAILPVSDYIEYMPNFQEKVEKWDIESTLDTLRQSDGKYYNLPGLHENVWPDYTLAYRKDILDENGWSIPETWDEFKTLLENMKEKYPDKVPFSDRWQGQALLNYAAASFGTKGGWGYSGTTFDEDKGEFVYTGTTNEYREMVTYFNSLVDEGLMDKESFTQDDEQALQKFVTGETFVISTNGQELINMGVTMDSNLGEGNYEVVKGLTPEGPAGAVIGGNQLENGIMISSKIKDSPNFKAILQLIDWLWYSDEGQIFAKWGVEGETYTLEDDKYTLTSDINFKGLNPSGTKDLQKDYGFSGGNFAYGGSTDLLYSTMSDEEVKWLEEMADKREQTEAEPAAPLSETDQEQASLLATPIKDFVDQSTLQFIVGQRDLSDWDAYAEEVVSKGSDRYLDMVNNAYEEYQKNNE